jgi:hypothetical protein
MYGSAGVAAQLDPGAQKAAKQVEGSQQAELVPHCCKPPLVIGTLSAQAVWFHPIKHVVLLQGCTVAA